MTFPDTGVMLCLYQYSEVTWAFEGEACGPEARIELLRDGEVCLVLAEGAPNTGVFLWAGVQQCGGETSGYGIRVTDLESGASDESDELFMIVECPEE